MLASGFSPFVSNTYTAKKSSIVASPFFKLYNQEMEIEYRLEVDLD